jgi:hypothetical protein
LLDYVFPTIIYREKERKEKKDEKILSRQRHRQRQTSHRQQRPMNEL